MTDTLRVTTAAVPITTSTVHRAVRGVFSAAALGITTSMPYAVPIASATSPSKLRAFSSALTLF